ncbi:MAG: Peptidyl-prolyl cis-trans isomerase PpiB [uncultured Cytophagales bacterium]|uniref:peptidylprolyl isomerase n=1 Tax=uncultured Cytophagales bacterium TaxID=158755 RepID=A0A6J4I5B6_9SPHI|nr:MAG: Peptidyl-prolyl cis-trans isomerase PpiB [uncultured Cytophagales bacterium]
MFRLPFNPILFTLFFLTSLVSLRAQSSRLVLETDAGNVTIELYTKQAPVTTANFLRYVNEGLFSRASFYRVLRPDNQPKDSVKISVLQGGLAPHFNAALAPIKHEPTGQTGLLHQDGTLSMVRQAPGTARSEFFICIGDQPALDAGGKRNPDGKGFAAFGKVTEGMDVIRKIHEMPANGQLLAEPVKILSISRPK